MIMIDFWELQRVSKFVFNHQETLDIVEHVSTFLKRWEAVKEAVPILLWYRGTLGFCVQ